MLIRISDFISESYVDGPGIRFTIFCQGCNHHCKGCHNPQTHDFNGGKDVDIEYLVDKMANNPLLDGITLSGGEPFEQVDACLNLVILTKQKHPNFDVICYTGYTYEQLLDKAKTKPQIIDLLNQIDYLIDGPFILELRDLDLDFMGSRNQRVIDPKKSLKKNRTIVTNFDM